MDRRQFLNAIAVSGVGTLLPGCALLRCPPRAICPNDPKFSRLAAELTIDAHAHVFNGSDLQIRQFINRVVINQDSTLGQIAKPLSSFLQALAWTGAPDGRSELKKLEELEDELAECSVPDFEKNLKELGQTQYEVAKAAVVKAFMEDKVTQTRLKRLRSSKVPFSALSIEDASSLSLEREIGRLPDSYETFKVGYPKKIDSGQIVTLSSDRSVAGFLRFVIQHFQYRYRNVYDYLSTYNQENGRVVDLLVAHCVDYDWPLNEGRETDTPLIKQVEVMERIAVLTRGRVHAFVPFDPMREVAFRRGKSEWSSLRFVQDAVQERGCLGVKMYPPMGFAPLGNAAIEAKSKGAFWRQEWLPGWMSEAGFGQQLDESLSDLYEWCESNGVPLMAHTNVSNGPCKEFQEMAKAKYWDNVLREYKNLRVSFGHFGRTDVEDQPYNATEEYIKLMQAPGESGAQAYADAGYFSGVLGQTAKVKNRLSTILKATLGKREASLSNRLMYGTDWEMTLSESGVDQYLDRFVSVFEEIDSRGIDKAPIAPRFFGLNAVAWLGLRKADPARMRLQRFYDKFSVETPDWMLKIDRM